MNLPNYFLADLPPGAPLRPELVVEAAQTLKRNRERFLLPRSTESIIQTLVEVARQWTVPHSVWRAQALGQGASELGLSGEVLGSGLDEFFRQVTARNLNALVVQDLGHPQRLDRLVANDSESYQGTLGQARGPEFIVSLEADPDSRPVPVFTRILHGLLVRSAQFVKCPPTATILARLWAHSLRDVEPKLAACLEIGAWGPGVGELDRALFAEADCVVASGGKAELEAVRSVLPAGVRWVPDGERYGAVYVAREMLGSHDVDRVLEATAMDVVAWDQIGEYAPQAVFVETGGMMPPEEFARRLAEVLGRLEGRWPRGPLRPEQAAAVGLRRQFYQVRAAASDATRCWFSPAGTEWSVVYEAEAVFELTCGHRFIHVKAVETLEECLRRSEPWRGRWVTVGLAAVGERAGELAQQFAWWGVTRICPAGRMQQPPLNGRRMGRPMLGDLITWTQVERMD